MGRQGQQICRRCFKASTVSFRDLEVHTSCGESQEGSVRKKRKSEACGCHSRKVLRAKQMVWSRELGAWRQSFLSRFWCILLRKTSNLDNRSQEVKHGLHECMVLNLVGSNTSFETASFKRQEYEHEWWPRSVY
jgi:hypothetical protein